MGYSIFDDTMCDMTWVEIEKVFQQDEPIVLWPTGVLEEHGPHMTLAIDIYFSYLLTTRIKEKITRDNIPTIIAPPNYWGINNVTAAFPGSFTLRKETLKALIFDCLSCLKRWGADYVFVIDIHGDVNHRSIILDAIREARIGCGIRAYGIVPRSFARYKKLTGEEEHILIKPNNEIERQFTETPDIHAGAFEGSIVKEFFPEQFKAEVAEALEPTRLSKDDWKKWASGWSDARKVIPFGYNGDPKRINTDLAIRYLESESEVFANLIKDFLAGNYTSPEV